MTQVVFNYSNWLVSFPEFTTTVTSGQGLNLFTEATLYLSNADDSPVQDIPTRTLLLNLVTAHLAQLQYGSSLVAANPIVGRIDGATEGSVSFTTKYPDEIGMAAWCAQTQYGARFWNATRRYRSAFYQPGPRRRFWPA